LEKKTAKRFFQSKLLVLYNIGDEGFEQEMTHQPSLESFLATCSFARLIDEKRPRQFPFFY
jgi:hypothetical protein